MPAKRLCWGILRVFWMLGTILVSSVVPLMIFPPADGDKAGAFAKMLLLGVAMSVIAWACVPWNRPELERKT